jgi:hypothetical protein
MAIAVQPDGKVLVAAASPYGAGPFSMDFIVIRYNSNITLDTSFGGNGIVITELAGGLSSYPTSITIQPNDAKIVVAGVAENRFALVR